jgi:hypothetical protein
MNVALGQGNRSDQRLRRRYMGPTVIRHDEAQRATSHRTDEFPM